MCPFFIITRLCDILGTWTVHLQTFMRILLRVWIAWLVRWKLKINIRVWNKTISCGSAFSANTIFSALMGFFLEMVGLFAYLPNLFFVVCLIDAKNTVCCSQLVLLEMFICWGNMPTDHDNCWPGKPTRKFVLFNLPILLFSEYENWTAFFVMFKIYQKNAD
jgi:hypothetical protein